MTHETLSLASLDVSDPQRFADDSWRPVSALLGGERQVQYSPDSNNGPY